MFGFSVNTVDDLRNTRRLTIICSGQHGLTRLIGDPIQTNPREIAHVARRRNLYATTRSSARLWMPIVTELHSAGSTDSVARGVGDFIRTRRTATSHEKVCSGKFGKESVSRNTPAARTWKIKRKRPDGHGTLSSSSFT